MLEENELKKIAMRYCLVNYDFCYLSTMHLINRRQGTKTIVVGSSHAMNGIVEDIFDERPINFSISSQDIFYAFQHIKKAVLEGALKIENCVINLGYYMLFQDVSLSKSTGSSLIPSVYAPLFGEVHHYLDSTDYDMFGLLSYDKSKYPEKLVREFCVEWTTNDFMRDATWYGYRRTRERNSQCYLRGIIWQNISEKQRGQIAMKRAAEHNHLKKYTETQHENEMLLNEMVCFLAENNIRTIFVVFPFTSQYNTYIDPDYKTNIYDLLDRMEQSVEFLDMNDLDLFDNSDFVDADHMNYEEAVKASRILNQFLDWNRNSF